MILIPKSTAASKPSFVAVASKLVSMWGIFLNFFSFLLALFTFLFCITFFLWGDVLVTGKSFHLHPGVALWRRPHFSHGRHRGILDGDVVTVIATFEGCANIFFCEHDLLCRKVSCTSSQFPELHQLPTSRPFWALQRLVSSWAPWASLRC